MNPDCVLTTMTIIGFDVAKHELVGVRTDHSAMEKESFTIPNNHEAIKLFLKSVKQKYPNLKTACEATAEYHRTLAKTCLALDVPLTLLNPIVTKQFIRATVRKKKTDHSDALVIARCAMNGEGSLITEDSLDTSKLVLRTMTRLGEIEGAIHRMEQRFCEHAPELEAVIRALKSIGETMHTESLAMRTAISPTDERFLNLLRSIPGIGQMLAPIFVGEIGSIDRFENPKKLTAFAGLDPRVKQSGISLKSNTHITKRGSPFLRRAAFIAASVAQRHDLEMKSYYAKKRAEGKRYREATIANARHILNRIYAVWKRGTPYIKNQGNHLSTAKS